MEKRKKSGFVLTLLFVIITGLFFATDFPAGRMESILPFRNMSGQTEGLPGQVPAETEQESGGSGSGGTDDPAAALSENDTGSRAGLEQSLENTETDAAEIYVYVCGQVKHPDVYCLQEGARVYEALEAAGGVTESARPEFLNLAEPLTDGQRVYVPAEGESASPDEGGSMTGGSGSGTGDAGSGLVNLNTASKEELMTLPGIGSSRADDILAYRQANGSFGSTEDLMKVSGIKEGVFEKLKGRITVR